MTLSANASWYYEASWYHERSWSGEYSDVGDARDFVTGRLDEHGLSVLEDDVGLVVSELVTNVVMYAPGMVRVGLLRRGSCVELQVDDRSPVLPVQQPLDLSSLGGRGLLLVTACSAAWGVRSSEGGKSVWATFDIQ